MAPAQHSVCLAWHCAAVTFAHHLQGMLAGSGHACRQQQTFQHEIG